MEKKKMQLKVSYYKPDRPAKKGPDGKDLPIPPREPDTETTANFIFIALAKQYPEDKLTGSIRRMCGRINRKCDEAVLSKAEAIELDRSEVEFLKDAIAKTGFPLQWADWINALEDAIDAVLKEA